MIRCGIDDVVKPDVVSAGGVAALAADAAAAILALATGRSRGRPETAVGAPSGVWTVIADDGTPLHVEQFEPSDGRRPDLTVVGVHGFALSAASWRFQHGALAALTSPRVRQLYYDHRGHGRSGRAEAATCTLEQLAHDLGAVLDSLVPDGPIVLVGHSMGGMTIMELAEQRPELFADRIHGVCLLTTAAGDLGGGGPLGWALSKYNPVTRVIGAVARRESRFIELVRSFGGKLTRDAVRAWAFGTEEPSAELHDFASDLLNANLLSELAKFLGTLSAHNRYAALSALQRTHVQVIGAEIDRVTPLSQSRRIASELPGSRLVTVPGAGHLVHLEQPDLVNSHLIDLLRRVDGATSRSSGQRMTVPFTAKEEAV